MPAAPAAALTTATATTTATAAAATATAHLTTTHHNITTQPTTRRCTQHDQHTLLRSSASQLDQPAQLARPVRLSQLAQLALLDQLRHGAHWHVSSVARQSISVASCAQLACFVLCMSCFVGLWPSIATIAPKVCEEPRARISAPLEHRCWPEPRARTSRNN